MDAAALILTDVAQEEAADELLAALSDLAYSTPSTTVIEAKKKHKSKFFFFPTESLDTHVKKQSHKLKAKKLIHVDDEIHKRLKGYKTEIPPELSTNIESVREFFLTIIAPRSLSSGAGASQAKEVVQRLLDTEIDGSQFDKFERMSHAAVNMVMAKFVANYYGLPKKAAADILNSILPRPQQAIAIPSLPQPYESRHARGRKEAKEIEAGKETK